MVSVREMLSLQEDEEEQIVVYTTSMGGIRSKVDECAFIRKLFDNLGLKVDERDIFMHKDYQCQLDKRLGVQNAAVPHVFVSGDSLGVSTSANVSFATNRFLRHNSVYDS